MQEIHLIFWLYLNVAWYLGTFVLKSYEISRTAKASTILKELLSAILILICSLALFVVLTEYYQLTRDLLLHFFGYSVLALVSWRFLLTTILRLVRKSGYNFRNVIILGYNKRAQELQYFFESNPEYGYRFIGFFDNLGNGPNLLGHLDQVETYISQHQIDEIYYANPADTDSPYLRQLVDFAEQLLVKVRLVPDLSGFHKNEVKLDFYSHLPIISFKKEPLEYLHNQWLKRAFDIVFSATVVIFVLSWMVPILGLIIRLDSPGPIFFRQRRTGKDNKDFWCLKFRTSMPMVSKHLTSLISQK
jgi:FlaA1/EpsC-like NDP-sugar epimerase